MRHFSIDEQFLTCLGADAIVLEDTVGSERARELGRELVQRFLSGIPGVDEIRVRVHCDDRAPHWAIELDGSPVAEDRVLRAFLSAAGIYGLFVTDFARPLEDGSEGQPSAERR